MSGSRSPSILQSELDPPIRICGVPDSALAVAAAQVCKWPVSKLTWSLTDTIPQLSEADFKDAISLALSYWMEVCDLNVTYTENARTANILIGVGNIDGRASTLAWSELPCSGGGQIKQKYDSSEQWVISETPSPGQIDAVRVIAHELGHGLIGLSHLSSGNLLQPTYDPRIRRPQAGDIAEAVRRYGKPQAAPPTGNVKRVTLNIKGTLKSARIVTVEQ